MGAPIRNLSRAEAKFLGLKRYSDGTPCSAGHMSDKLVSNYTCIQCLREKYFANRRVKRRKISRARAMHRAQLRGSNPLPASPEDARRLGQKRYFTGKPCPRGHISPRFASGNTCIQCVKEFPRPTERERERRRLSAKKHLAKTRIATRRKYHTDIRTRIRLVLRCRMKHAFRAQAARRSTSVLLYLGCTVTEARAHLEKLFSPGMTWDNYGYRGWHIDHIIPLASFDLMDEQQRHKAFHYTNLQPLWARDNHVKGRRLLQRPQDHSQPIALNNCYSLV